MASLSTRFTSERSLEEHDLVALFLDGKSFADEQIIEGRHGNLALIASVGRQTLAAPGFPLHRRGTL